MFLNAEERALTLEALRAGFECEKAALAQLEAIPEPGAYIERLKLQIAWGQLERAVAIAWHEDISALVEWWKNLKK